MFCPQCIHMFFIILRTYRNYLPLQHELVSFDMRRALRLLRGTDWVFKYSSGLSKSLKF